MGFKNISIIDYGSGNIRSIFNALNRVSSQGSSVKVTGNLSEIISSSHLIIPGVGSFQNCINSLRKNEEIFHIIKKIAAEKKVFILGICVGMQILASYGDEFGKCDGLNIISGSVEKIPKGNIKLPHVGWNSINIKKNHAILENIHNEDNFYFTHSFYFKNNLLENTIATTNYGTEFSAIVGKDNIIGTQFHPEKSGENGLKLLSNFINQKL